jgi:hydroxymethylpyrimidine pyrophosphatase-like HAD family hydrolase
MPERYETSTGVKGIWVPDLIATIDRPVVKVLGIDMPEHVVAMIRTLSERYRGILNLSYSDSHFLEIAPINASKGKAIANLAQIIGVKREHTLALGDSLNDLSMIQWAGMSCSVGECADEVISSSTWNTCKCEDDGAAIMIEALLDEGFRPE